MLPERDHISPGSFERRGPADRRLGERRLQLVAVAADRRTRADRRGRAGRRESAAGHLRNALQMLETALAESESRQAPVDREYLAAVAERLRQALHEVDRLHDDRATLGRLLRVQERGLTPDTLPGLKSWPA